MENKRITNESRSFEPILSERESNLRKVYPFRPESRNSKNLIAGSRCSNLEKLKFAKIRHTDVRWFVFDGHSITYPPSPCRFPRFPKAETLIFRQFVNYDLLWFIAQKKDDFVLSSNGVRILPRPKFSLTERNCFSLNFLIATAISVLDFDFPEPTTVKLTSVSGSN